MKIDLNADLGEGFGPYFLTDDEGLLEVVTSANIACGMHAGDPVTMVRTCRTAGEKGVVIGAHPGYADIIGFGRRAIPMSPSEIEALVAVQIGALQAAAGLSGNKVRYVKPHGALYSLSERDEAVAQAICRAVRACGEDLLVMTSPVSVLLEQAPAFGLSAISEGFADRRYEKDGSLAARSKPGAVIEDVDEIAEQALRLATGRGVVTGDGTVVRLAVQTICLHGDGPSAMEAARRVRARFEQEGITISAFAKG